MPPQTNLDGADPAHVAAALADIAGHMIVPHAGGQAEILAAQERFQVACAGRRWGKTKVAARKIIRAAMAKPGSLNWWVSESYKSTRRGYQEVVRQIPRSLLAKPAPPETSNDLILRLTNGSVIEFYSGGNPEALAGAGVHYVVIDEAALIPERVWYQLIRPTLMDTGGSAFIISTPRGRNWFWKMWKAGQGGNPGYKSWRFPQWTNPYVPADETEEARATLPDVIFKQEIAAEFVSSNASIFNLDHELAVLPTTVDPAGQIVLGVDLAKKADFTVLSAARAHDRMPVLFEKFNELSWPVQRSRIHTAVEDLLAWDEVEGVTVLLDSTGLGDVVFDDLEDEGLDVIPVNFSTSRWKERAVTLLAADLERGDAHILDEQVPEFESYEYEITDAGRYKFQARTGHDDEVSAKLLEHWGIVHEAPPTVRVIDQAPSTVFEEVEAPSLEELMNHEEVWSSL